LGAPPKDHDLLDVIRDLATSVHNRDGAVVYIDPAPLHGSSQHDHIDIHLQGSIQDTLVEVMLQTRQVCVSRVSSSIPVPPGTHVIADRQGSGRP
jgi:hypothetical protein